MKTVLANALDALLVALNELEPFQEVNGGGGWHHWMRPTPAGGPTTSLRYPQGTIEAIEADSGVKTIAKEASLVRLTLQIEFDYQQNEDAQSGFERLDHLLAITHMVAMRQEPDPFGGFAQIVERESWALLQPLDQETVIVALARYAMTVGTRRGDPYTYA